MGATFTYSITVMVYGITRLSATIYSIMPTGERTTILLNNGFSIAYSGAVFSLLMTIVSSLAGPVSGVILKHWLTVIFVVYLWGTKTLARYRFTKSVS